MTITLYSHVTDVYSHRVRILIAHKGITANIIQVDLNNKPEDLAHFNPYHQVPTLVEGDVVLYESRIIMEYLDERYPYPPLQPVYPADRARNKLIMHRIDVDWYSLLVKIMVGSDKDKTIAREDLTDSLTSAALAFPSTPYLCGEALTLVDCSMAALLWRLPYYGILLPVQAKNIKNYAKRLFELKAFQTSLTEQERTLGEKHCI